MTQGTSSRIFLDLEGKGNSFGLIRNVLKAELLSVSSTRSILSCLPSPKLQYAYGGPRIWHIMLLVFISRSDSGYFPQLRKCDAPDNHI